MTQLSHLTAENLDLHTPQKRALFHDLHLTIHDGDRVALVGRNGVGKSTLLRALAGALTPTRGQVRCSGTRQFLPQLQAGKLDASPGEERRRMLEAAFLAEPNFLLLDEPSLDLDAAAVEWLVGAIRRFRGACLVVSHDRRVLRLFNDFFVVEESGCHHHHGEFDGLMAALAAKQAENEDRYKQKLSQHVAQENKHLRVARRSERKKNLGRARELKRCPARAQLNGKRGYAQESQARRAQLQANRIDAARDWAKAVRRSLRVDLPLELFIPQLPEGSVQPTIEARGLCASLPNGNVSAPIDLRLSRERILVSGPNGCGKSTLVQTLLAERLKAGGQLHTLVQKLGYVAQNATNWRTQQSLLEHLCFDASDLERAAALVSAHRFPVALAQRPLVSLSPGERVRAALLALFERQPAIELLVLDEPNNHLDLVATAELERILRAWPGGLLVVSHDREFARNIGIDHELCHTNHGFVLRDWAR